MTDATPMPTLAEGEHDPVEVEIIMAMCRAHDREEAAQKGEPSPWREDLGAVDDPDWVSDRFFAMREAFDEAKTPILAQAAPQLPPPLVWTVGQAVVEVTKTLRHEPSIGSATVTKVGKKWASLSTYGRFSLATGQIDGGGYSSPGRVYPTREAYDEAVAFSAALDRVRNLVQHHGFNTRALHPGLTAAHLDAFLKLATAPDGYQPPEDDF